MVDLFSVPNLTLEDLLEMLPLGGRWDEAMGFISSVGTQRESCTPFWSGRAVCSLCLAPLTFGVQSILRTAPEGNASTTATTVLASASLGT